MEFNFRRAFFILMTAIAGIYYIQTHYHLKDVLSYSHRHPNRVISPKLDYYVGMAYYMRSRHPESVAAFQQLLTDYPTCQYAPGGLLRMGQSQEELGRWAEAREAYQRYLEEFPEGRQKGLVQRKYEALKFK